MRTRLLLVFAVVCLMATGSAYGFGNGWYFAQDDMFEFHDFVPGLDPISTPGVSMTATGKLMNWTTNSVQYLYELGGINPSVVDGGTAWETTYQSTFVVKTLAGATVWSGKGTVTNINQKGHVNPKLDDGFVFYPSQPQFNPKPVYGVTTQFYESWGYATWLADSGYELVAEKILLPWFGTYDWSISNVDQPGETFIFANAQGALYAVPEPMTILLGMMGLGSVAGFRRLRKS